MHSICISLILYRRFSHSLITISRYGTVENEKSFNKFKKKNRTRHDTNQISWKDILYNYTIICIEGKKIVIENVLIYVSVSPRYKDLGNNQYRVIHTYKTRKEMERIQLRYSSVLLRHRESRNNIGFKVHRNHVGWKNDYRVYSHISYHSCIGICTYI